MGKTTDSTFEVGVTRHRRGKHVTLTVDTNVAKFKGFVWKDLGAWGKKKYDNYLYLHNALEGHLKIIYV